MESSSLQISVNLNLFCFLGIFKKRRQRFDSHDRKIVVRAILSACSHSFASLPFRRADSTGEILVLRNVLQNILLPLLQERTQISIREVELLFIWVCRLLIYLAHLEYKEYELVSSLQPFSCLLPFIPDITFLSKIKINFTYHRQNLKLKSHSINDDQLWLSYLHRFLLDTKFTALRIFVHLVHVQESNPTARTQVLTKSLIRMLLYDSCPLVQHVALNLLNMVISQLVRAKYLCKSATGTFSFSKWVFHECHWKRRRRNLVPYVRDIPFQSIICWFSFHMNFMISLKAKVLIDKIHDYSSRNRLLTSILQNENMRQGCVPLSFIIFHQAVDKNIILEVMNAQRYILRLCKSVSNTNFVEHAICGQNLQNAMNMIFLLTQTNSFDHLRCLLHNASTADKNLFFRSRIDETSKFFWKAVCALFAAGSYSTRSKYNNLAQTKSTGLMKNSSSIGLIITNQAYAIKISLPPLSILHKYSPLFAAMINQHSSKHRLPVLKGQYCTWEEIVSILSFMSLGATVTLDRFSTLQITSMLDACVQYGLNECVYYFEKELTNRVKDIPDYKSHFTVLEVAKFLRRECLAVTCVRTIQQRRDATLSNRIEALRTLFEESHVDDHDWSLS